MSLIQGDDDMTAQEYQTKRAEFLECMKNQVVRVCEYEEKEGEK